MILSGNGNGVRLHTGKRSESISLCGSGTGLSSNKRLLYIIDNGANQLAKHHSGLDVFLLPFFTQPIHTKNDMI
jgi:hypothetical protein